ncbi:MAG TPA: DUF4412 domain-containing protein [Verrucomicrobiae bacterium]|nr:DUF4412 domain-containing protein [Verrucomicrobiae bacterium]
MKTVIHIFLAIALLGVTSLSAQPMGGAPGGPNFSGAMDKLFGDNQTFSATMETTMIGQSGKTVTMPGNFSFDSGKSRFEVDMTRVSGGEISPGMTAHLKQMGMDKVIMISRPDKKLSYMVYPGLQSYAEVPVRNTETNANLNDFKVALTELGKETVAGHPCVKNKAVVTDKNGDKHESLVWNATDLKNFPVKIQATENGNDVTTTFTDVKFSTPDASLFDPPSGYQKYNDMMEMMRDQMMKRMGGGMPPH